MLDILIPVPVRNAHLFRGCLEAIEANTAFQHRIVAILDGGVRDDYKDVIDCLTDHQGAWKLLHNDVPVLLNQSLREGLEECTAKITAIIAPQVRIDDEQWVGKAQAIFNRDPAAGVVDTEPNTKSATLHPIKRAHNRPPMPGCRFAIVKTGFAAKSPVYSDVDPITTWARSAMTLGLSSWFVPSIRYHLTEHQEHKLWRAHSAMQSPSA